MNYSKTFEIRWSDLDANRHLANSAYQNMMSHTRMGFLLDNGFTQSELIEHNIGPIVFYEHIYYFKELLPKDSVEVDLKLKGLSENGMFFSFEHDFFNPKGQNCARCEMMGAWIDMKTRKLVALPKHLLKPLENLQKTVNFKQLTKEDTRKYNVFPKNKT